MRKQEPQP